MNATAVGLVMGLRTKKAAARACLENYLHVLDTNEPINRMEGNFGQAQLESKNAQDVRKALHVLRQAKVAAAQPGMDPLKATATGAALGAATGGALSFGDAGMMGRGALAGGSVGFLVSAVDRIVARRGEKQRMEKPAAMTQGRGLTFNTDAIRKAINRRRLMTGVGAVAGSVIPGVVGYGVGSALGGASNVGEKDPEVAKARRRRFAQVGGVIGAAGGAARGAVVGHMAGTHGVEAARYPEFYNRFRGV